MPQFWLSVKKIGKLFLTRLTALTTSAPGNSGLSPHSIPLRRRLA
jgi:hypothetical protein